MSEIFAPLKKSDEFGDRVTGVNFKTTVTGSISAIALESFDIVKYSFSNSPNLRNFRIGNFITISGCDNVNNDGEFRIEAIDYDSYWIKIRNSNGVADVDGGGSIDLSIQSHAMATYDVSIAGGNAEVSLALPSSAPTAIKKTVGASAISLSVGSSVLSSRKKVSFQPVEESGTPKFFVGDSNVTSSGSTQGIEVFPGVFYEFEDLSDWYIISDTAAQSVVIIEQS